MSLTPPDEVPAPEPAVATAREVGRQLSLFGVEAADPDIADLAGLLAGPGEITRMGGTARVSVLVADAWRVHVLAEELSRRGLTVSWEPGPEGGHEVRTAYSTRLARLAAGWLVDTGQRPTAGFPLTGQRPPAGFHLNGRRLRLWTAAAGEPDPPGFLLRLGPVDPERWRPVRAALVAVGLAGELLEPEVGGVAYRISGRRRLARLAELVGDRPPAAPRDHWP